MTDNLDEYLAEDSRGNKLDWVRVEGQKKFRITRREWTNQQNLTIHDGEEYVVPRNARGMKHFFRTNEYFKVIDADPSLDVKDNNSSEPEGVECSDCGRTFDTERGLKSHRSQAHKTNKNEEEEE